jgi:hypothetical protein
VIGAPVAKLVLSQIGLGLLGWVAQRRRRFGALRNAR